MTALVQIGAPPDELVATKARRGVVQHLAFFDADPTRFERFTIRHTLEAERLLRCGRLRIENDPHAGVAPLDPVVDAQHALDVDLDPSFFPALAESCLNEIFAKVNCATRNPPTTIPGLIHCHVLAVRVLIPERIATNNQTELVSAERCPLLCHAYSLSLSQ